MQKVQVLSHEPIFHKGFIKLFETRLRLSNSHERVYYDAERNPAVSVFPIDGELNIYLVSQYRYILDRITIEAVAGIIEDEKNALETAKKELSEEAGITAKEYHKINVIDAAGSFYKTQSHLFIAKELTFGKQKLEELEDGMKIVKLSLDDAVSKVLAGEITTASTVIGILLLERMRREGQL